MWETRMWCGTPTAWTILQNDDPDHLGARCNALPEHQMALVTSDFVSFREISGRGCRRRRGRPWTAGAAIGGGQTRAGLARPGPAQITSTGGCSCSRERSLHVHSDAWAMWQQFSPRAAC